MRIRLLKIVNRALTPLLLTTVPVAAASQVAPAGRGGISNGSAWEFFFGYSYFAPNDVVIGQVKAKANCYGSRASSATLGANGLWNCPVGFDSEEHGSIESVTRYFNCRLGVQIDAAQHDLYYYDPTSRTSNSGMYTVQTGPVYRLPISKWTPWAHGLAGGGELQGPQHQKYTPGFTFTLGGGLDYETPWLNHRLAIRLGEADYEYMHVNYGTAHPSNFYWQEGGVADINKGFRLSGGVVFRSGPGRSSRW